MRRLKHIPRKRFGQHFLHNQTIIERIVAAIQPRKGDHLVEIGPGRGALTRPLLAAAGALDVIELDRDLIPRLQTECKGIGELHIHQADALRFDFTTLVKNGKRLRVVGNLPYNISTPLLFHLLSQAHAIQDMHFMLQKEVVQRMVAPPGGKDYGRLSVMLQYRCRMEKLFTVGAGAFSPPPKIESAVVRITPHAQPAARVQDEAMFARLVSAAFARRRKTLRNSLKTLLTEQQIRALGLPPDARAEQLSLQEFAALSNAVPAHRAEFIAC
jgi:16S rRNA (adenine1518-N6/adenine1519-N6)-dimethyltransferase